VGFFVPLHVIKIAMEETQFSNSLLSGCEDTIKKIVKELFLLDSTIRDWNEELKRAQPLLSGKVILRFSPTLRVSINAKLQSDHEPRFGKMIKKTSGRWAFVWLSERDKKLGALALRVGKSFPSDRVVVRLITGIEAMLEQRNRLVGILKTLRSTSVPALSSSFSERNRRIEELPALQLRIKMDWQNNADACFESMAQANRIKNASKPSRAKKVAPKKDA
jgi:hypothetical protein